MGNFIFGYNFLDGTDTASSENPSYPLSNIKDYEHLKRHWRSTVITESWVKRNFGQPKNLLAVCLDDVNFTTVTIQGNATDTWTSPAFSQVFTISKDKRTQRYKGYLTLSGFNYKWLRILIPAQTPVDGLSAFRIGRLVCLNTVFELSESHGFTYEYSADEKMETNEFLSGSFEDINRGDFCWQGSFSIDMQLRTNEDEIWRLNALKKNANLVFYENNNDTTKFYVCRRRTAIEVTWKDVGINSIKTLSFREMI